MKKFSLLTVAMLLVLFNISVAQKLTLNLEEKYDEGKSFTQYYCGVVNGSVFYLSLRNSCLIEYPTNSLPISKPLQIDNVRKGENFSFIGAYIANDQINVVYKFEMANSKNVEFAIYVGAYDLQGNKKSTSEIFNYKAKEISKHSINEEGYSIIMSFSENKNFMSFRYKNEIQVYDTKSFKRIKSITIDGNEPIMNYGKHTINCFHSLLDNGDVITIQNVFDDDYTYNTRWNAALKNIDITTGAATYADNPNACDDALTICLKQGIKYRSINYSKVPMPITITKYTLSGNEKKQIKIPIINDQNNYGLCFKLSNDNKTLYIASNYGKKDIKSNNAFLNTSLVLPSTGIQLTKINLEKMEILDSKSTGFDESVTFLTVTNILEDINDVYVVAGNLSAAIIIKFSSNNQPIQKTFKLNSKQLPRGFEKLSGEFSILNNGSLYLLYSEPSYPKQVFKVVKMDSNLEIKNKFQKPILKDHNIKLQVQEIHKLEANKYIIMGIDYKSIGSAILELD